MQKKKHSLLEALTGTAIGFCVAWGAQVIIFHAYGIKTTISTDIQIVFWFTLVSVIRGYCVRRLFNWLHTKGILA